MRRLRPPTSLHPASVASSIMVASDLEVIVDQSPIAMCIATKVHGVLRANHAAAALTGWDIETLLGHRLLDTFVHPDDVPHVTWVGERVLAGTHTAVRHRLLTAGGDVRHVRGSLTPIMDNGGAFRYAVAQYVDETEFVVASRELARQRAALAEFAEVVAHDLRTPLTGLTGAAALLQERDDLDCDAVELVDLIAVSADEAVDLVERTLRRALAAESRGTMTADLIKVVDSVRNLLAANLAATGGRITYTSAVRFLLVDEAVLEEILLNLCQNSIKFRGERSPEIGIEVDSNTETLSVVDNGRGIPAEQRDMVFCRGHQTSDTDEGDGLGLSRVRRLIEEMGGSIVALANEPFGTRVTATLPGLFVRGDS